MYTWPSPGKLNLFLYVTGYRPDGYHYLQTLFQLIDYGDQITFFITNQGKIRLFNIVNNALCHNNLILKAAKLLHNYCGLHKKIGVDIFVNKILPIGSGLGGGSSNAATTLVVLNQKWHCFLKKNILMCLGLQLGADVPLFIHGYSSFSEGIGEKLVSVFLPKRWYLIVIPPIQISTKQVFNLYALLNNYSPYRSIKSLLKKPFFNDLEPVVKKMFPEIEIYFKQLSKYTFTRLTGTGSCIFSEFYNKNQAIQIQKNLPFWMKSIIVSGLNISSLHKMLLKKYNIEYINYV